MFAIMRTGGKQYRVQKGDKLRVEKLDVTADQNITIDDVLMVSDGKSVKVGEPAVKGASVLARVIDQVRNDKITIFKKKRRQNYRRKKGHTQNMTLIEITDVKSA
ncbi:MAG TPA: 50S ribosomal protein L21 [Alphaproteobacteria bacterium]|nr:50S ribosomal protein L21 [Alphaproteobacteria bacterium]